MNSDGETIGPSLNFDIRIAMNCEFFVTNTSNSCVMQYWPVSLVFG